MVEAKVVTTAELLKDNPRICLSAKRVFNKCYECPVYEKCESRRINEEYLKRKRKIDELKTQIKEIEQEIKNLEG